MSHSNENNPISMVLTAGSVGSDLSGLPVAHLKRKMVITGVHVADRVGIAANDTDYILLTLKKGSTSIATYDSRAAGQGALAAGVYKDMLMVAGQEEQEGDLLLDIDLHGAAVLTNSSIVLSGYPK